MSSVQFRFRGDFYGPPGCAVRADPRRMVISAEDAEALFVKMKHGLLRHEGVGVLTTGLTGPPITVSLQPHRTACRIAVGEFGDGRIARALAVGVFLPGLDNADDQSALDSIRQLEDLGPIAGEDFEKPMAKDRPRAAVYFTSQESMNSPVIFDLIKLAYAAFVDQLGLGHA